MIAIRQPIHSIEAVIFNASFRDNAYNSHLKPMYLHSAKLIFLEKGAYYNVIHKEVDFDRT